MVQGNKRLQSDSLLPEYHSCYVECFFITHISEVYSLLSQQALNMKRISFDVVVIIVTTGVGDVVIAREVRILFASEHTGNSGSFARVFPRIVLASVLIGSLDCLCLL